MSKIKALIVDCPTPLSRARQDVDVAVPLPDQPVALIAPELASGARRDFALVRECSDR